MPIKTNATMESMNKVRFDEIKAGKPYVIKIGNDRPIIIYCKEVKDIRWRVKELITDGNVFSESCVMQQCYVSIHRGDFIFELDEKEYNDFIEAHKKCVEFFKSIYAL